MQSPGTVSWNRYTEPWRWPMLTILFVAAAISGSGDTTYSQANRRDPFVPLLVACPKRSERITHITTQLKKVGFSAWDASFIVTKLTANLCYPRRRQGKGGDWKVWEEENSTDKAVSRGIDFMNEQQGLLATGQD